MKYKIIGFIGIIIFALALYGIYNMFLDLKNQGLPAGGTTTSQSGNTQPGGNETSEPQTDAQNTTEPGTTPAGTTDTDGTSAAEPTKASDVADFENKELAGLIANKLGIPASNLTYGDLMKITELEVKKDDIRSGNINDLVHLKNLETLRIFNLPINGIGPIPELSALKRLELVNCELTDIPGLSNLRSLEFLNLSFNKITSAAALKDLTSIKHLDMHNNMIGDISELAGMKAMTFLDLSANKITDAASLKNLIKLESLALNDNLITDISPISDLKSLRSLRLRGNKITNGNVLAGLSKNLVVFVADFSLNLITGSLGRAGTGITGGNLANGSAVNTDGDYLYYMHIESGEDASTVLMKRNVKSGSLERLTGSVNEQMALLYGWKAGDELEENLYFLNSSGGRLYYCAKGFSTINAGTEDNPNYVKRPLEGIVSMKSDGSSRTLLKKGSFTNLVLFENKLYYLNSNGQVWTMGTDGSNDKRYMEETVDYFCPIPAGLFVIKDNNLYLYRRNDGSFIELVNGCRKFISSDDFIYYINGKDEFFRYDMSTGSSQKLISKAGTFNISAKYIFYSNPNDSGYLWRADLSGGNARQLRKSKAASISVLGDYVFIKAQTAIESPSTMLKFDGSE